MRANLISRASLSTVVALSAPAWLVPSVYAADYGASYHAAVGYIGEHWNVLQGGARHGSRYLDNLDLMLGANLEPAFGIPMTLQAHALYNNGRQVSADLVGDAQGISNIEAVRAWRLFEAWAEWRLDPEARQSLRLGLYDVNSEFDVVPAAGLFIGASHGMGREFSQTGDHGPSTFPVTSVAVRYQWQIDSAWTVQAAALDGVPGDPEHPDRTTIRLSSDEGALLLAEVSRSAPRVPKLALGIWQYTAKFDHLLAGSDAGASEPRRTNRGVYALGEVALIAGLEGAHGADAPPLSAFVRVGGANGDLNRFDRYLGAGLVLRGLIGEDELGIAVAQARNSDTYRRAAALEGAAADRVETNLELTWRIQINERIVLQPDIQYIINPGTDPQLDDAVVVGLRFEVTAQREW